MIKHFQRLVFILLFGLLAVFLVHNFDSIGQDIGRHLKTGEIIWQTKEIPKINLFSFTQPESPFINHHWLSEVIFYGVFSQLGFSGLILLKVFLVLIAFLLITDIASRLSTGFWPLAVSFLLSILIFISRTEVRPEIFSYAILVFFLFALFKAKYPEKSPNGDLGADEHRYRYLWFLPLAQLLWVNLHIYFFIGPTLFFFFLIDRFVEKKTNSKLETLNSKQTQNPKPQIKKLFGIFVLVILATLVNPAGINGALLPLNILNEYGYSVVENQALAFLADFFGFNLPIFIFKVSATVLAVSFLLTIKKTKERIFEILISAFFIYAGFKMLRNLPLYALVSFPVTAILLTDVQNKLIKFRITGKTRFYKSCLLVISGFLVFMLFFVASGDYYKKAGLSKTFGMSVPNGLERAVNFVKENKIDGPMFNNFDIGGYLIWKLPEHKVFVDNRPEAYSVQFFSEIYKPMQENKEKWAEFSEKYGINFIFFGHGDSTPWGQAFMVNIVKNSDWKIIYVNEEAIILVKNNEKNSEVISRSTLSRENAVDRTVVNTEESNENSANLNTTLSRLFYNISWREASVYFAEEAIRADPQNPQPYLYKGLIHAYYTDAKNQKLASENIKKAIDLGLKESRYYYILGVVYMNLNRLDEAQLLFEKALELDKNNAQAREFLEKYFKNYSN